MEPFIDVIVVDSSDLANTCSEDYPDEVIYDVWLGTQHMCDCLKRRSDLKIDVGTRCIVKGTSIYKGDDSAARTSRGQHASEDCFDVPAIPPIFQSSINWMRVCGKRATNLSLANETRRPVADSSAHARYSCPASYVPRNPEWLLRVDFIDYVTCIKDGLDLEKECPITSFALSLDSLSPEQASLYLPSVG